MDGARVNQHVSIVRANPAIVLPSFVATFLRSPDLQTRINSEEYGVTRQALTKRWICELEVPIPPIAEQRRIIDKVEKLLAGANAARHRLMSAQRIIRRFRQSVLAAACSGKLTEEWRSGVPELSVSRVLEALRIDHDRIATGRRGNAASPDEEAHDLSESDLPSTWMVSELQYLCEPGRPITYGILKPGPDSRDGIPYVRVADFPNDRILPSGIRRTTREIADAYRRSTLRSGDVLLSIRGTFGRVCRVPPELDGANITQDTARLSIDRRLNADFVALYLRSPGTQSRMKRAAKGVAVRGVNIGDVRALQIGVPPVAEQAEIVRRVEECLRLVAVLEKRVAAAAARVDKLTQTVLAQAFRGELVPTEAELVGSKGGDHQKVEELLERAALEIPFTVSDQR
jgi:type I restriction enzyme S subunit